MKQQECKGCEYFVKSQALLRDNLTFFFRREVLNIYNLSEYKYMVFIDVVNLKQVNETQGYILGDMAIMRTAMAITKGLYATHERDYIVIRYGGDEFIILTKCEMEWDLFCTELDTLAEFNLCPKTHKKIIAIEGLTTEEIFENLQDLKSEDDENEHRNHCYNRDFSSTDNFVRNPVYKVYEKIFGKRNKNKT